MFLPNMHHIYIIFPFLFIFYLLSPSTCQIRSMKKISKNGDYFVILDGGLYIYIILKNLKEKLFFILIKQYLKMMIKIII